MQSFTSRILSHKSLCPLVSDQHRSNWKENKFGTKFHRGGGGEGGGGLNNKETDGTEKLVRGGVGGGGVRSGPRTENNNAAIKLRTIGLFYKTTSSIHFSVVNFACKYHCLLWKRCFQLSI